MKPGAAGHEQLHAAPDPLAEVAARGPRASRAGERIAPRSVAQHGVGRAAAPGGRARPWWWASTAARDAARLEDRRARRRTTCTRLRRPCGAAPHARVGQQAHDALGQVGGCRWGSRAGRRTTATWSALRPSRSMVATKLRPPAPNSQAVRTTRWWAAAARRRLLARELGAPVGRTGARGGRTPRRACASCRRRRSRWRAGGATAPGLGHRGEERGRGVEPRAPPAPRPRRRRRRSRPRS